MDQSPLSSAVQLLTLPERHCLNVILFFSTFHLQIVSRLDVYMGLFHTFFDCIFILSTAGTALLSFPYDQNKQRRVKIRLVFVLFFSLTNQTSLKVFRKDCSYKATNKQLMYTSNRENEMVKINLSLFSMKVALGRRSE